MEHKHHSYLEIKHNETYFGNVNVIDIATKYGTPVYVYSEDKIRENYDELVSAFTNHYPNFKLHYAIKANTNINILKILKSVNSGADCSNVNEVQIALKAGFTKDEILFTSNYTSLDDVRLALKLGVTINLDDASLLEAFDKKSGLVPERICFRLNPGIGYGKFDRIITAGPNAKFGIPEKDILDAYKKAKDLGIKRFGIHMMTGSCVLKPEYFQLTTHRLFKTAHIIAKKLGIKFEFINIGGGFGIPYTRKEHKLEIKHAANLVIKELKKMLKKYDMGNPKLLIEPGRFIVGNSGILVSTVTVIKHGVKTFVGSDAGMNVLLRPALYNAYHEILIAENPLGTDKHLVNVCGQVCENTDILAKNRLLPLPKRGNHLVFLNAGAYGFVMSSQYNNLLRPAEVLVTSGKTRLIRKRDSFDDLIKNQVF